MYLALYRKYRPRTFDDVISQEHITTTLKNQVANQTTAHAYLFTGSRGTGKTTCAKILAMAVNCLDPQNGNPCLKCERCREIMADEATDIVEMDAASNNGVDNVRQLRDEVAYTPVSCKYRVYIIDEVHMLSAGAFNALLKTLEEPPPHAKFILATTELYKVPATISSRCQRFEFRRVDVAESTQRLLNIAEKENIQLDEDAAELISRISDGGMRDALSLLDLCISVNEHVTAKTVRESAGVADNKHLFAFSEMVAKRDAAGCIRLLSGLYKGAKDLALVIGELSTHYRDIMLFKTAPNDTDLLTALPEDHQRLAENAALYDLENVLRCLTLLQQCSDNIGKTKQRKTLAEICLVKMCNGIEAFSAAPRVSVKPQQTVIVQAPLPSDIVPKSFEEMSERERLAAKRTKELVDRTVAKLKSDGEKDEARGAAVVAESEVAPQAAESEVAPQTAESEIAPQAAESEVAAQAAESEVAAQAAVSEVAAQAAVSEVAAQAAVSKDAPQAAVSEVAPQAAVSEVAAQAAVSEVAPQAAVSEVAPQAAVSEVAPQAAVSEIAAEVTLETSAPPWEEIPLDSGNVDDSRTSGENPPEETASDSVSAANELTMERWKEIVSQLGFMYEAFFTGSTARLSGGVLEVSSSNPMLLNNVKDDELNEVGEMISGRLGFPIRLKIKAETTPETDSEEKSKLDKLLSRAQQLGIEVQNKNDQNGGQ